MLNMKNVLNLCIVFGNVLLVFIVVFCNYYDILMTVSDDSVGNLKLVFTSAICSSIY